MTAKEKAKAAKAAKPQPQVFSQLNESDEAFMSKCRIYGASLLKQNLKSNFKSGYELKDLDVLVNLFIDGELEGPKNAFVNSMGVLFGDFLVESLKMKWTVVEDEYGRDYGTHIKKNNVLNFPLNEVMSAIEHKRPNSLFAIYTASMKKKKGL